MTDRQSLEAPAVDLEAQGQRRRLPTPKAKAYDPAPFRDKMRAWLAIALVALLALTILLPFLVIAFVPTRAPALQDHLALIFTPLVALVASAVGYYFGARTSNGA